MTEIIRNVGGVILGSSLIGEEEIAVLAELLGFPECPAGLFAKDIVIIAVRRENGYADTSGDGQGIVGAGVNITHQYADIFGAFLDIRDGRCICEEDNKGVSADTSDNVLRLKTFL